MHRANDGRRRAGSATVRAALALALSALVSLPAAGAPLRIYIDADRSGARASGLAIEQGVRTALSEAGDRLAGHPVEIVLKDHRGSTRRSTAHLRQYLADDAALVVVSGLHSPPLLANRDYINDNAILVLDPWAAAGPITRHEGPLNWIFRLSIDDTKAGPFIVDQAVRAEGFRRPYLLLEETGWGRSNHRTMSEAVTGLTRDTGVQLVGTHYFNWNIGDHQALTILRAIVDSGADVIFLVANAGEGKTFARAMMQLDPAQRLPVRSHWGITGGDFAEAMDADMLDGLDLAFIQTRYPFLDGRLDDFERAVFQRAQRLFPAAFQSTETIRAPAGFVHAYDLTRLLIAAAEQAGLSGDVRRDRARLRDTLESLDLPVRGLLRTYRRPFEPYRPQRPDAHEALTVEDYVMATYGANGKIRPFVP